MAQWKTAQKIFDGKPYFFHKHFILKRDAQSEAEKLRKRGRLARITYETGKYARYMVWGRGK